MCRIRAGAPPEQPMAHRSRSKHGHKSARTVAASAPDPQAAPLAHEQPALRRREYLAFAAIFLLALAVRLFNWWGQWQNNPFAAHPTMDEEIHHQWAMQIASGQGLGRLPYFRAPLYYYLLAGIYALFGPNIALARLFGNILGAVTCCLIARLGVMVSGFSVGVLAGLIAAFYWPLVYFDNHLLTVGVEVFLNLLMLLLLPGALQRRNWKLFLAAGVVWGLAALARPNILAFAPAILLWLWLTQRGKSRSWRWLSAPALVFAGAAATIAPVTLRNRLAGGEWVLIATNGGVNFYIGNNPQADGIAAVVPGTRPGWQEGYEDTHRIPELELGRKLKEGEISRYWFAKALEWIRSEPGAWLRLIWLKFRLFFSPEEIGNNLPIDFFARRSRLNWLYPVGFPLIACLAASGMLFLPRNPGWALLLLYFGIYLATVVLFFCPARYRLPAVPVLILLAAHAVLQFCARIPTRQWKRLATAAMLAGVAGAFLWSNPPDRAQFRQQSDGQAYHHLGLHYYRLGRTDPAQLEKAREYLMQAQRLRPADWTIRRSLGAVLADMGRFAEAEAQYQEALRLNPADPDVHLFYGCLLQAAGRLKEAAEHFKQTLAINPREVEAHLRLGAILKGIGQEQEAQEHLRRAVELRPDLGSSVP
jgi:tetratricopeptide (TPR) repeat protein